MMVRSRRLQVVTYFDILIRGDVKIFFLFIIVMMMMITMIRYLCNKDEDEDEDDIQVVVSFFLLRGGVFFCRDYLVSRLHN